VTNPLTDLLGDLLGVVTVTGETIFYPEAEQEVVEPPPLPSDVFGGVLVTGPSLVLSGEHIPAITQSSGTRTPVHEGVVYDDEGNAVVFNP
jgi:hypothetical protein